MYMCIERETPTLVPSILGLLLPVPADTPLTAGDPPRLAERALSFLSPLPFSLSLGYWWTRVPCTCATADLGSCRRHLRRPATLPKASSMSLCLWKPLRPR